MTKTKRYYLTERMDDPAVVALLDLYADFVAVGDDGLSGADFVERVGERMERSVVPLLREAGYDYVLTPRELDHLSIDGKNVIRAMEARRKAFWRRLEMPASEEGA